MPPRLSGVAEHQQAVLALDRIRQVWGRKRKAMSRERQRDIRLGLERIQYAVQSQQQWVGVHVGGTNGKGSICAFLAALFKMHGVSFGTFTSPAIPKSHNSITVGDHAISRRLYDLARSEALNQFKRAMNRFKFHPDVDIGDLTPFELETAAAFRIFNKTRVQYGIVEVGMGGKTDATNIMRSKGVTIIGKIGLDHQEYLGHTLQKITAVKAGIMRHGIPCVVDSTNSDAVLRELDRKSKLAGSRLIKSCKASPIVAAVDAEKYQLEDFQKDNLACAVAAFQQLFPHLHVDVNKLLSMDPFPPGRLESIGVDSLTNGARPRTVIADGSHNKLGMETLARYVNTRLRDADKPVTWIMGISGSRHKSFSEMIETIARPQDRFAIVEYTQQANDPPPASAQAGRDYLEGILASKEQIYRGGIDLPNALQWASSASASSPVVITGSLYLIRELYNLPGVSSKRIKLTEGEAEVVERSQNSLSRLRQLVAEDDVFTTEARDATGARHSSQLGPDTLPEVDEDAQPAEQHPSPFVTAANKTAQFHREQVSEAGVSLRKVSRELEDLLSKGAGEQDKRVIHLLREFEELDSLRTEHQAAFIRASNQAESGRRLPEEDSLSDRELLHRWYKQRQRLASKNPFVQHSDWELDSVPVPDGGGLQEAAPSAAGLGKTAQQPQQPRQGQEGEDGQGV